MQQGATLRPPTFIDLNVLPEELRPLRHPSWYLLGLVVVLLFGLLLVPLYGVKRAGGADTARLSAELELIRNELADVEINLGEARGVRQELETTEATIARLTAERREILGHGQEVSADLSAIMQALPPGTRLASITAGDGRFTLTGRAGQPTDVLAYYRALAGSGSFSQARITSMTLASGQQGGSGVTFTIEVTE